jgi:hypothetical protein
MSKSRNIADLGSNDVIETSASGVDVTGTVTADGLTVDGDIGIGRIAGSYIFTEVTGGNERAGMHSSSLNDLIFKVNNQVTAIKIDGGTRDVSFYEDTGTTAKFVWDASAESLGIGTSSLTSNSIIKEIHVDSSTTNGLSRLRLSASGESQEATISMNGYLGQDSLVFGLGSSGDGSATERMRIDSSGNVGIGIASPLSKLTINGDITHPWDNSGTYKIGVAARSSNVFSANSNVLEIHGADATVGPQAMAGGDVKIRGGSSHGSAAGEAGSVYIEAGSSGSPGKIIFNTGATPTERARIDSNGNLLVGTTDISVYNGTSNGVAVTGSGYIFAGKSGDAPMYLNRISNDGAIIAFNKDGSIVGSIGSLIGSHAIYNSQNGFGYLGVNGNTEYGFSATNFYPTTDNGRDLGINNRRWDDIYATNGTIQTSDINEKQDIEALDEAEQRVAVKAKTLLRKFRWKDSVAEKGDDARIHFGIMAQDLQQAFTDEGLDAGRYAMFTSATWTDEETGEEKTRMGVRYNQLLAFIISAI